MTVFRIICYINDIGKCKIYTRNWSFKMNLDQNNDNFGTKFVVHKIPKIHHCEIMSLIFVYPEYGAKYRGG